MKNVFTATFGVSIQEGSVDSNAVIKVVGKEFESKGFSVQKINVKKIGWGQKIANVSVVAYIDAFESKVESAFEFVEAFPNFMFDNIQVAKKK